VNFFLLSTGTANPGGAVAAIPLPTNIAIAIVIIAAAYAISSVILQRKINHPTKMREMQTRMNALTKEMVAKMKSKEDYSHLQAEHNKLMAATMKNTFKTMAVTLPIFALLYYVMLPMGFGAFKGDTVNFIIPLNYQSLFFWTAFALGMVVSFGLMARDKVKAKKNAPATVNVDFKAEGQQ
jgi:uncharacterized membrane protein (DUF106 family)